ncbi:MAG: hypothetical protein FWE22_07360 [Firmicutes bacterium]|nr:hypothetical protein [Bacillota bacterium]
MKKTKLLTIILVLIIALSVFSFTACDDNGAGNGTPPPTNGTPVALTVPTGLLVEGNTLSWVAVSNASSYEVRVGTVGTITPVTAGTSIELTLTIGATYRLYVRAIGDGTNFTNSNWSAPFIHSIPEQGIDMTLMEALFQNPIPNPFEFFPQTMLPTHNIVNSTPIFNNWTNISAIGSGHASQWNMILENIAEMQILFSALGVVNTLAQVIEVAVDTFATPDESGFIDFSGEHTIALITYSYRVQLLGNIAHLTINFGPSQIHMSLNVATGVREGRAQLTDTNAFRFISSADSIELGFRYLGLRRSYLTIERVNENLITGSLVEFTGLDILAHIRSASDFFITPSYTTVVGNRADSMLLFSGSNVEVYLNSTGRLLGWAIREASAIPLVPAFHTVWLNLSDITGLSSIIHLSATDNFRVNNRTTDFAPRTVGGILPPNPSRRFDIEFRVQYFSVNDGGNVTRVGVQIPQMFIQIGHISTFTVDVINQNSNLNISIGLAQVHLNRILDDYDNFVRESGFTGIEKSVTDILIWIGERI